MEKEKKKLTPFSFLKVDFLPKHFSNKSCTKQKNMIKKVSFLLKVEKIKAYPNRGLIGEMTKSKRELENGDRGFIKDQ